MDALESSVRQERADREAAAARPASLTTPTPGAERKRPARNLSIAFQSIRPDVLFVLLAGKSVLVRLTCSVQPGVAFFASSVALVAAALTSSRVFGRPSWKIREEG